MGVPLTFRTGNLVSVLSRCFHIRIDNLSSTLPVRLLGVITIRLRAHFFSLFSPFPEIFSFLVLRE